MEPRDQVADRLPLAVADDAAGALDGSVRVCDPVAIQRRLAEVDLDW